MYIWKASEISHSHQKLECNHAHGTIKKYLIVDDFVQSGTTIRHITDVVSSVCESKGAYPAKPVGIFCYDKCQDPSTTKCDNRVNITPTGPKAKLLKIYTNK